jgi:diphthamide biosynthesis methyltransferase
MENNFTGELFMHYRTEKMGFGFIKNIIIMYDSCEIIYYDLYTFKHMPSKSQSMKNNIKRKFIETLELAGEKDFCDDFIKNDIKKSISLSKKATNLLALFNKMSL